ncbi:MAG: hypothetical protein F6K39_36040 [Okeania sp. SIO3B3]|nr:hypothetical protein [Okeania sp. SIO3B3]
MNLKLFKSLAEIINNLTPEEKQILGTMINLIPDNNQSENQFSEVHPRGQDARTGNIIQDETFVRHPQGNFE